MNTLHKKYTEQAHTDLTTALAKSTHPSWLAKHTRQTSKELECASAPETTGEILELQQSFFSVTRSGVLEAWLGRVF